MHAVIRTGGKQYRVAKDDILNVEKLNSEPGATIDFDEVLMVGEGEKVKVGSPTVKGAKVTGEVVEHARHRKVIAFKKRRRKDSRSTRGHRQHFTKVKITSIKGA